MNNNIVLLDILDEKQNTLNSQAIINSEIIFEMPRDYYFDQNATNIEDHILQIKNSNNINIKLCYESCNEKDYNKKITKIKNQNKINEDFINYREQQVVEYVDTAGINITCYDGKFLLIVSSKCDKYSNEYYILYYISFSLDRYQENYDNKYYQKNNYCILSNAKYVYDKYKINLIKNNPFEKLVSININAFSNYISGVCSFDWNNSNYYVSKEVDFKNIVEKIDNYKSINLDDDLVLVDMLEE